ncbi:Phosphoglycerate mutase [Bosea sp. LC85]|uniref:histidine phosphatase family protein n=1 Tax=Bosea sp. LC85 TaxID=1502851 RepID=UPI0004E29DF8|nr:histidine phosphatase family protein [Bosea sp. LC85]KFC66869.1 Phosphoglycerate mutase [Bosea sp. LC85]
MSRSMLPLTISHRLFLVRHGETDWNREGRLQGSKDIPLNELGREQAAEAAGRLRSLVQGYDGLDFVASPMERARETMEILRYRLGLPPKAYRIDERLRELTFGTWEGFTWREVRKSEREQALARERDKWSFVPPEGESYRMLAERIRPVLETLTGETVMVSHGGVARAVLALVGAVAPGDAAMVDIWQGKILKVSDGRVSWV